MVQHTFSAPNHIITYGFGSEAMHVFFLQVSSPGWFALQIVTHAELKFLKNSSLTHDFVWIQM